MKKLVFFFLGAALFLASCSSGATSGDITGNWQVTAIYENDEPGDVGGIVTYNLEPGGTFTHMNITENPADTIINHGNWNFDEGEQVLTLSDSAVTLPMQVIHFTGSEMHWQFTLFGTTARIELEKQ